MELRKPEAKKIRAYSVTITRYEQGRPPMNKMVRLDSGMVKAITAGQQVTLKLEDADFIKAALQKPEDEL